MKLSKNTRTEMCFLILYVLFANASAEERFKHNNEIAFVLNGAVESTISVEPAGLVFNLKPPEGAIIWLNLAKV